MSHHPLHNYLRTYRRRSGFSQAELAALLGALSGTKVSRYENAGRMPGPATVWAYEIIFGLSSRQLFAGAYSSVEKAIKARAERMIERLLLPSQAPLPATPRKLAVLRALVEAPQRSAENH